MSETMSNSADPSSTHWSQKEDSQLAITGQLDDFSMGEKIEWGVEPDNNADDAGFGKSEWGLGQPVALEQAKKSYIVFDCMDQQDGETHFMLQDNNNGFLYHGHTETKKWQSIQAMEGDGQTFAMLELEAVSAHQLFPEYESWMQKYTGSTEAEDVFMKKQTYLKESKYDDCSYANCTLREVMRNEELSKKPHKHLAQYRGVETKIIGGVERVVRIAYQRYSMDLETFLLQKRLDLDNQDTLMQGMRDGIKHLHEQNLVHCDLRPANVFVTFKEEEGKSLVEEVVVGDFDASLKVGEPVNKRACGDWFPPDVEWGVEADVSFDDYSLGRMEKEFDNYLMENGLKEWDWGNEPDYSFPQSEASGVPDWGNEPDYSFSQSEASEVPEPTEASEVPDGFSHK